MQVPRSSPLWLLGITACFGACGAPPESVHAPAAVASAAPSASVAGAVEPPDDPLPSLRTGSVPPVDQPGVRELKLEGRHVANGYEILGAEVPAELLTSVPVSAHYTRVAVDGAAGQPSPLAFVGMTRRPREGTRDTPATWLWVRRPVSQSDATGDLFVASTRGEPAKHYRFHIGGTAARPSDAATLLGWVDGLSDHLRDTGAAWAPMAVAKLDRISKALSPPDKKKKARVGQLPVRPRPVRPRTGDLSGFLETSTGFAAVQEALQSDRTLWYASPEHKATLALSSLQLPPLKHHPWAKMLARLDAPPAEPLAGDVPAEFYYLRASGLTSLLDLLDQLDTWGTAAGEILEDTAKDRDLAGRYQAELALRRGPLTRALGPAVVGEVGITGSDPYLEEGSDLTILFRVKDRGLFDASLVAAQAELEQAHGALVHETRDHAGTTVRISRSADGAVHQQRATLGDVEIVSNSPHAIDAVLDAAQGRRPRLADEPDFEFMLARDSHEKADVLAFLGDRFVAEAVGPRQKVLELRRLDAQGELESLGAAAILYGLIQGKSPTKVDDLIAAGLITPDDLEHTSGDPITWQVGSAPRSVWGTPASLTPLIDLPTPDKVSPDEKSAYEAFGRGYQQDWSYYIDPVAFRVAFGGGDTSKTLGISMRELPLIDSSKYSDIVDFVGTARFTARPIAGGARLVGGIAQDSEVRRDVSHLFRSLSQDKLKLDWIGDWAEIGCADRTVIAKLAASALKDDLQPPTDSDSDSDSATDFDSLAQLPLYAEVAIKSPAQAAIAIAGARMLADSTIPGMFDWGEMETYRGVALVRVSLKGDVAKEVSSKAGEIDVFYAMANGALVLTTKDWLLRRLVDDRLDGRGPTSATAAQVDSAQMSFELASSPGKGIWTSLAWLLEQEMIHSDGGAAQAQADALLRGAPEIAGDPVAMRALAMSYFGATPVSPDGKPFSLDRWGASDPSRGSSYAPKWPEVPVPGSPVERVLRAVSSMRTQVSFDDEGKDGDARMRSMHAAVTVEVKP